MATRDENIKKINDELEKLSDDELDKIAGGDLLPSNHDKYSNFDAVSRIADYFITSSGKLIKDK